MEAIRDWGAAAWGMVAAVMAFVPRIVGALIILLIGWGIAGLLARLAEKGLDALHFDRRMASAGMGRFLDRAGVRTPPSGFVAGLVKWFVLLITFLVAADALGLPQVSEVITAIVAYIPNVVAAVAIIAIGALLADFLAGLVRGALGGSRPESASMLSSVTYWAIMIFAILGAVAQLQIAPALVQTLYTAVIGAVAVAAAIAFGLGLRDQAGDLVVGRELASQLHPGDMIRWRDVSGRIERIGSRATWVRTPTGLTAVPNHLLAADVIAVGEGPSEQRVA